MNIRELTYVALKITGILSFLWAFRMWEFGSSILMMFFWPGEWIDGVTEWTLIIIVSGFLPFLLTLIVAFLLLARTDRVIKWLSLPEVQKEHEEIKVEHFLSAAFAIMGIILMLIGVSKLIRIPGQFIALNNYMGQ